MGGFNCKCVAAEKEITLQKSFSERREENSQKSSKKQKRVIIEEKRSLHIDQGCQTQHSTNVQARCLSPSRRNQLAPIDITINKFDMDIGFEEEQNFYLTASFNSSSKMKKEENNENFAETQKKPTRSAFYNKQQQELPVQSSTKQPEIQISFNLDQSVPTTNQEGQTQVQLQQVDKTIVNDNSLPIQHLGDDQLKKAKINDKKITRSLSIRRSEDANQIHEVGDDEQSLYSKGGKKGILRQSSLYKKQKSVKKDKASDNISIGTMKSKKSVHFDEKSIKKKNRNFFH